MFNICRSTIVSQILGLVGMIQRVKHRGFFHFFKLSVGFLFRWSKKRASILSANFKPHNFINFKDFFHSKPQKSQQLFDLVLRISKIWVWNKKFQSWTYCLEHMASVSRAFTMQWATYASQLLKSYFAEIDVVNHAVYSSLWHLLAIFVY